MLEGGQEGHKMRRQRVRLSVRWVKVYQLRNPRLQDINTHCLEEFRRHYECLEQHNQQMWQCRRPERVLNRCVFQKIVCQTVCHYSIPSNSWQGLEKNIPDAPSNLTPVHLRDYQIFANDRYVLRSGEADVGIPKDKAKA